MFERYYVRPVTVDRIRTSWIAPAIEQYVGWLTERRYSSKTVLRRIPLLIAFGEFAKERGATDLPQLAEQVEPFVDKSIALHAKKRCKARQRRDVADVTRNAVRQMLRLAIPGYVGLLLATYGLRGCEVAALTLDDINWRDSRLKVRERKAGNSTTYPLSTVVGAAIIDYLKHGRPASTDRPVFLRTIAPFVPISPTAVTCRAAYYIRKAGVKVPRPGSHTLRHSCVQHLVNANFSLKHIGDYVGHRNAASTQIYGKVAIEALREVAQGGAEEVL